MLCFAYCGAGIGVSPVHTLKLRSAYLRVAQSAGDRHREPRLLALFENYSAFCGIAAFCAHEALPLIVSSCDQRAPANHKIVLVSYACFRDERGCASYALCAIGGRDNDATSRSSDLGRLPRPWQRCVCFRSSHRRDGAAVQTSRSIEGSLPEQQQSSFVRPPRSAGPLGSLR